MGDMGTGKWVKGEHNSKKSESFVSIFGLTAHWIHTDPESGKWTLHFQVIAFKGISGTHTGDNLGCYFVSLCEWAGIIAGQFSKLFCVTADNTSNNNTTFAVMSGFTQLANVKNATSIWEFDPSLAHNHVLTNELDVIAAV
ncbi:hypothetical protein BD769DRAFT_1392424 [Suillus cothurnatus]|nr:hypothetical protein BD769DRAFT_1392424 [Suillus cothurnatus]